MYRVFQKDSLSEHLLAGVSPILGAAVPLAAILDQTGTVYALRPHDPSSLSLTDQDRSASIRQTSERALIGIEMEVPHRC